MTKFFLESLMDAPAKELTPAELRRHEKVMKFLEKERIDPKMTFEVAHMGGSDWVYVYQRWRS